MVTHPRLIFFWVLDSAADLDAAKTGAADRLAVIKKSAATRKNFFFFIIFPLSFILERQPLEQPEWDLRAAAMQNIGTVQQG